MSQRVESRDARVARFIAGVEKNTYGSAFNQYFDDVLKFAEICNERSPEKSLQEVFAEVAAEAKERLNKLKADTEESREKLEELGEESVELEPLMLLQSYILKSGTEEERAKHKALGEESIELAALMRLQRMASDGGLDASLAKACVREITKIKDELGHLSGEEEQKVKALEEEVGAFKASIYKHSLSAVGVTELLEKNVNSKFLKVVLGRPGQDELQEFLEDYVKTIEAKIVRPNGLGILDLALWDRETPCAIYVREQCGYNALKNIVADLKKPLSIISSAERFIALADDPKADRIGFIQQIVQNGIALPVEWTESPEKWINPPQPEVLEKLALIIEQQQKIVEGLNANYKELVTSNFTPENLNSAIKGYEQQKLDASKSKKVSRNSKNKLGHKDRIGTAVTEKTEQERDMKPENWKNKAMRAISARASDVIGIKAAVGRAVETPINSLEKKIQTFRYYGGTCEDFAKMFVPKKAQGKLKTLPQSMINEAVEQFKESIESCTPVFDRAFEMADKVLLQSRGKKKLTSKEKKRLKESLKDQVKKIVQKNPKELSPMVAQHLAGSIVERRKFGLKLDRDLLDGINKDRTKEVTADSIRKANAGMRREISADKYVYQHEKMWPLLEDEYGISISAHNRFKINMAFGDKLQSFLERIPEDRENLKEDLYRRFGDELFVMDEKGGKGMEWRIDSDELVAEKAQKIEEKLDVYVKELLEDKKPEASEKKVSGGVYLGEVGDSEVDVPASETKDYKPNWQNIVEVFDDNKWVLDELSAKYLVEEFGDKIEELQEDLPPIYKAYLLEGLVELTEPYIVGTDFNTEELGAAKEKIEAGLQEVQEMAKTDAAKNVDSDIDITDQEAWRNYVKSRIQSEDKEMEDLAYLLEQLKEEENISRPASIASSHDSGIASGDEDDDRFGFKHELEEKDGRLVDTTSPQKKHSSKRDSLKVHESRGVPREKRGELPPAPEGVLNGALDEVLEGLKDKGDCKPNIKRKVKLKKPRNISL